MNIVRLFYKLNIYKKMYNTWRYTIASSIDKPVPCENKKNIIFELRSRRDERIAIILFYFFDQCFANSYLIKNNLHLSSFLNFKSDLVKIKSVFIVKKPVMRIDLVLCDTGKIAHEYMVKYPNIPVLYYDVCCFKRTISGVRLKQDFIVMPYAMHPTIYKLNQISKISYLRKSDRLFRIFFSGNSIMPLYDNYNLKSLFEILSRAQIISSLQQELDASSLVPFDKCMCLTKSGYINKLVLHVWTEQTRLAQSELIKYDEWLDTLAKADFFLHCPGIAVPQCHNQIESMAVGCIPITEFPHMFEPALENGINCISYKGESGLLTAIQMVLSMPTKEITNLRNNVINYYDSWLSPQAFVSRLEAKIQYSNSDRQKFYIISDYSVEYLLREI
ncbi:hypothetical protein SAMN00120144_0944 [Hymenobacter roseosalivarius DSM 11622]|uniref:Glycosyl transferase group 1 n=2 Tax=Hymenobacter roseosalivarius TaxID=89967 RepID=A0A1W1V858_9BACT|nr:hypothetical protein SAMN00120144_0944 [Hymenobacter roseosalivarius DSM 11622]